MAVCVAQMFPGFLTPVLTQLFFLKPPTAFLTCFRRGERRKYAGKKVHLNRGSNSQPPGHESDTLTTERRGRKLTKVSTTDFKIDINGISDPLEMCKNIFSPQILIYQPIRNLSHVHRQCITQVLSYLCY